VDLVDGILHVRQSKFGKSRLSHCIRRPATR
jgi:hypothetical protein